jgi:hypothetical protein
MLKLAAETRMKTMLLMSVKVVVKRLTAEDIGKANLRQAIVLLKRL